MAKTARTHIDAKSITAVGLRGADGEIRQNVISVDSNHFYGSIDTRVTSAYLIVGFDTEFKSPDKPVSGHDIRAGDAKSVILSYQVHCSVYDPDQPAAREWSGICYPEAGQRLTLADLLTFAVSLGVSSGAVTGVPRIIYLAGHFTRADVPSFADFKSLAELLSSVRSTFLSINRDVPIDIRFEDGESTVLSVILRDTMLLTPAASKSLAELGKLVGVPKIDLDPNNAVRDQFLKENMDAVLRDDPELFERYAINDALICVKYLQRLIDQYETLMGIRKIPATLTSIGVDLLIKTWGEDLKLRSLDVLGKESIKEKYFSKKLNRMVIKPPADVYLKEIYWHVPLATESYHGGRNEQFWFGPGFEDDWTDYDLAGAYPTAMALIGMPDWRNARANYDKRAYTPTTLGFANVDFKFPDSVRFPTMPVRTDNGLVFPREGNSSCSAPEIALALDLGATLTIKHGVIIPTDLSQPAFADFTRQCILKRKSYDKGTLENLFWKELANSTYGKTAQGLRKKRVFDIRDQDMKFLPESKITNPFFASYITSFVRAALGEVMNGLPEQVCVFSCTTDGFLTNATVQQIDRATTGQIADLYRESRKRLTGKPEMLEIKHQIRKPLGWRTRGQATLTEGHTDEGDDVNIVLAKGGIYTSIDIDDVRRRNAYVVNLFLNRTPEDQITVFGLTGIKDIVMFDADLVEKETSKRLSMEYDWKCRPSAVWQDDATGHVAFSTVPWDTIDEFIEMRRYWESFGKDSPRCIKTLEDFKTAAVFVLSQSCMTPELRRYISRQSGADLRRLRQSLCLARRHGKAGLRRKIHGRTDEEFAQLLVSIGIACKTSDVENARKEKPFKPKACPATPDVLAALAALKGVFHSLDIDEFVADAGGIDMVGTIGLPNPFTPQTEVISEGSFPSASDPTKPLGRKPIPVKAAA